MNIFLLSSLFASLAAASTPAVASLGSSYSSGYGLNESYGQILADLIGQHLGTQASYDNFAIAGTNVTNVASSQAGRLNNGKQYTAVVITAGGNDLNYVACLYNPSADFCGKTIDEPIYIARYGAALSAIVGNLTNPAQVPIYVVDYIQALGKNTVCDSSNPQCKFTPSQVLTFQNVYTKVTNWTVDAVAAWKKTNAQYNVKLYPYMRQDSADHDVGAAVPWINGAVSKAGSGDGYNWHPNEAGARFEATAIFDDLYPPAIEAEESCG